MKFGTTVLAAVAAGGLVAACNIAVDSPLGVHATTQTVLPGKPVTGRVVNPDGKVTVALQNFVTHEITTCIYKTGKKTFSCPTSTDAEGLYVVGVTDTAHPDDGTAKARVAVTAIDDYLPQVSVQDKAKPGQDVSVALLMWGADRTVTVKVLDKAGKTVFSGKVTTAKAGDARTTVPGLKAGTYSLVVNDRLWTIGGDNSDSQLTLTVAD